MLTHQKIDLRTPLSLKTAFGFPLQNSAAKKDLIKGSLWLLVPIVGWLMNMGHRILMVHNMQHGRPAWPAWEDHRLLLKHGFITFLGMVYYYLPAGILLLLGYFQEQVVFYYGAGVFFVIATIAIPGYMSHYCRNFDKTEIFNPLKALSRPFQIGTKYWKAWGIALTALSLSFLGLLALGFGFLFTSVWFWQVAGYSFANAFTNNFNLDQEQSR